MSSTVASIAKEENIVTVNKMQKMMIKKKWLVPLLKRINCMHDMRKVIHSIKVGIALILVSLLYLLDPLFKQVGENGMWAIMTVVVVFEFHAGATLSKGVNRGIGTILGGGLGCLAAVLADEAAGIGHASAIIVVTSVFLFGAAATYCRMVPSIKRRHEYGAMIFILTFNLVVVSGWRADDVVKLARDRLATIGMGFAVCVFTNLLVFPMWASDELHYSIASKFEKLAFSIDGCLEEYFEKESKKENPPTVDFDSCQSILHFKSKDESLANFAKWEPWHGKFGIYYPWGKYLEIGEVLRELAAIILSLKGCIKSSIQPTQMLRQTIKEPCEILGLTITWILRELGESIMQMKKCRVRVLVAPKLQSMKQELSHMEYFLSRIKGQEDDEALNVASFYFLFTEMVEKLETLAKRVDELGELAGFESEFFVV